MDLRYKSIRLFSLCCSFFAFWMLSSSGAQAQLATSPVTSVVSISSSEDDAEEDAKGQVSVASKQLELVYRESNQNVGLRFNVAIPPGAKIVSAYVTFLVSKPSSANEAALALQGEAADNALVFKRSKNNISSRLTTQATVSWLPAPWDPEQAEQRTPDLSPIVQEIVDRPGWLRGNALALIITGQGRRIAAAYDADPNSAATLYVEYHYDDSVTIDFFSVQPETLYPGEPVKFSWLVAHKRDAPVKCELDVDSDGNAEYSFDDCASVMGRTHSYPVAGHYRAKLTATDGKEASEKAFLTLPVTTQDSVVLSAVGDIACDPASRHWEKNVGTSENCRHSAISDLIVESSPDAVAVLGDIQYEDGTLAKFMKSYDPSWGRFKAITYPAVGNHEYLDEGAAGYFAYFGEAAGAPDKGYYSYTLGNWHIVVLNSNCSKVGCAPGSAQEQWLREDLVAHPAKCTLAYWHHPRYSSGQHGNYTSTSALWQALDEADAELVLSGHDHHYERFAPQDAHSNTVSEGIRQFVVGTGGKNHYPVSRQEANSELSNDVTYGILNLTLHPESYDWEFIPESAGQFSDTGTARCH